MCSFATRSATDFNLVMLRFVGAQTGLLSPHPDSISGASAIASETSAAAGNRLPAPSPAAATASPRAEEPAQ